MTLPKFLLPESPEGLDNFYRVLSQSIGVCTHFDLLTWLQGELQSYLPHDLMVAAWGDFQLGDIRHDVISPISDVRSHNANTDALTLLLQPLHRRWLSLSSRPYALNVGKNGFVLDNAAGQCSLGKLLKTMRSALVHGIRDERHGISCLYVSFSTHRSYNELDMKAVSVALPHIDAALRQVSHLPQQFQTQAQELPSPMNGGVSANHTLSSREMEIMFWVGLGKTNAEIGSILHISEFTVKNHLQRVFKKLNVTKRAHAVSKFGELSE